MQTNKERGIDEMWQLEWKDPVKILKKVANTSTTQLQIQSKEFDCRNEKLKHLKNKLSEMNYSF